MRVAFRLRKRPAATAATALLLVSPDVTELLRLCARIGSDAPPRLYAVPGGFLLKLATPGTGSFPNTIRLRGLSENLFVPVDADLVPDLLPDEAAGLVRDHGLIFLPAGRVLGFHIDQPLSLSSLLTVNPAPNRTWQPFPACHPQAERLFSVLLERPEETPDAVFAGMGGDIGTEAPQLNDPGTAAAQANDAGTEGSQSGNAGAAASQLGRMAAQTGWGMTWLGNLLGLRGLRDLGAGLIRRAAALFPRLTEAMRRRQQAALRALLEDFRAGNLERALRRALPLSAAGDRGRGIGTGDRLPVNDPRYSLDNIRDAPGPAWLTEDDLRRELEKEYRKAAEQAAREGDHRRAAFIYGKLLRDYRAAANMLLRAGLYHDAATLFLSQVGDALAAARAFESAGEIDRAVQLYRLREEHVLAADLLRRAGDEEAALSEYGLAAVRLWYQQGHLAAGELLLEKARRPDLALTYFEAGWASRPQENALPCALYLLGLHAEAGQPGRILELLGEAADFFAPPGNDLAAGKLYNAVARLAEHENLADLREELRDRALLGIAAKLRQRAAVELRPSRLVSMLLEPSGVWDAPVVRDADFAWKAAVKRPERPPVPDETGRAGWVRLGTGAVTAACSAPGTGDVFVGFQNGAICCFRPSESRVVGFPPHGTPVLSLATDAAGRFVVALRGPQFGESELASYGREGSGYGSRQWQKVGQPSTEWLTPVMLQRDNDYFFGLWAEEGIRQYRGSLLVSEGYPIRLFPAILGLGDVRAGLLLPGLGDKHRSHRFLLLTTGGILLFASHLMKSTVTRLGWVPAPPQADRPGMAPIAFLQRDADRFELSGVDEDGYVCWSECEFREGHLRCVASSQSPPGRAYSAVGLVRLGLTAGVHANGVDWLRCSAKRMDLESTTRLSLPPVVGCFPSHATGEVNVVSGDGFLVRVCVPG